MEQADQFVGFGVRESVAPWIFDEGKLAVDALADRWRLMLAVQARAVPPSET